MVMDKTLEYTQGAPDSPNLDTPVIAAAVSMCTVKFLPASDTQSPLAVVWHGLWKLISSGSEQEGRVIRPGVTAL